MQYLIKRRPGATREELVAHWFANHMPLVITGQEQAKEAGRLHAWRYIATLFDAAPDGTHAWDGVAQLWWDQALPSPKEPHGSTPADSFQERALPYTPWATTEYVVIDGSDRLPVRPNTLNQPFPCTRTGFFKVTFLVGTKPGADTDAFFAHWLDVHVPNVKATMEQTGGWRYVVSHSIDPSAAPFAGMAELYFDDATAWKAFLSGLEPDGMDQWSEAATSLVLRSQTEMVGIA